MGRQHVAVGDKVTYTYCPPASGSHYNAPGAGPIPPRLYGPNDSVAPAGLDPQPRARRHRHPVPRRRAPARRRRARRAPRLLRRVPEQPGLRHRSRDRPGPVIARFDQMATPFAAIVWGRVLPLETFDQAEDPRVLGAMGRADQPGAAVPRRRARLPSAERRARAPSAAPSASAAPSPELTERRRPMRLVSYLGPDDVAGDGRPARRPADPGQSTGGSGSDLDRRGRSTTCAVGPLRSAAPSGSPIADVGRSRRSRPRQDRLRRAELPRARRRGRPPRPDPAAPVREVRQRGHRRRRADRPAGGHPRPRSRGRARRRHRPTAPARPARRRARARRGLRRRQRRQRPRLAGRSRQPSREGETGDGQWLRAKGSDTFLPMGPVFVTADEIPDPQALRLRSWRIPGLRAPDAGAQILMQDSTTADMIWGVAELIAYISRVDHARAGRHHRHRHPVRASASSATRRSSSSRATASAARSTGIGAVENRSSTGPRTSIDDDAHDRA